MNFRRRAIFLAVVLLGCKDGSCNEGIRPIPETTTRIDVPKSERADLTMKLLTTEADCNAAVKPEEREFCMPYVDRGNAEVRLAFLLKDEVGVFPLPLTKEHITVGLNGHTLPESFPYTLIPHQPVRSPQLFILLIDGSTSMKKAGRMEKVRSALLMPEVKAAFFPTDVNSRVVIYQFTDKGPQPLGGKFRALETPQAYSRLIREHLKVQNGYTHLFDAIRFATGPLLARKDIKKQMELYEMTPTVVALTDGFNNQNPRDKCRDNASRLNSLLEHLSRVRSGEYTKDPRRWPSVYTVGLGRPLRPGFKLPSERTPKIRPVDLCGRRNVDRRIDGDLEERGIDNASLAWIAHRGGGTSYVRQDRDGLGEAFQGAAAERYEWFEVRYQSHPAYLRRKFNTRLRLEGYATAEASVDFYPSAWLDAPPGKIGADGWSEQRPFRFTAVVLLPFLGLALSISFFGATVFNTQRVIFGRLRRPPPPVLPVAQAPPPQPVDPPAS